MTQSFKQQQLSQAATATAALLAEPQHWPPISYPLAHEAACGDAMKSKGCPLFGLSEVLRVFFQLACFYMESKDWPVIGNFGNRATSSSLVWGGGLDSLL